MWIEQAFRDLKSHGWQLEQVVYDSSERVSRLWIVLVVAYAWMLLVGTAVLLSSGGAAQKRRTDGSYLCRWSVFREARHAFWLPPQP